MTSSNSTNREDHLPMTSTDLDRIEESSIDLLPAKQPPAQVALAVLREAAQAMEVAHHYASAVCNTQVCPTRFRGKPDDGAAAILYGLEIGLSPAQSLQRVVVIHGMPSLEARTMVGLLKARGYRISTLEQSDEQVTVEGFSPEGERAVSQWTIERAKRAGYVPEIDERTGKYRTNANGKLLGNEKYLTDPQAMLKAKAQAEVCRDLAPDVLMGIQYSSEELQSERWDGTVSVERQPSAAAPITVDEIMAEPESAPKRQRPAGASRAEGEAARERQQTTEPAAEAPAVEQPAEPPAPVAAEAQPESETPPAAEEPDDDELTENAPAKVKQLFALLREGDITDREDRLTVFTVIAERPIGSTNDLQPRELNRVIAKLKGWQEAGTLAADLAELLWRQAAAEADTTEGN